MNNQPKWTGKSETFVNQEQLDAEWQIEFEFELYRTNPTQEQLDRVVELQMNYIKRFKSVDKVLPYLEGYEPGPYLIEGERVLVAGRKSAAHEP
jgi:hypothetical protein